MQNYSIPFIVVKNVRNGNRDFAQTNGHSRLDFIGSVSLKISHEVVAAKMRETLGFSLPIQKKYPTSEQALSELINLAENAGILVMINGVVMNKRSSSS